MITETQAILKRGFDLVLSLFLIFILMLPILVLIIMATFDTKEFGLFSQTRVGQFGRFFKIFKIRTLRSEPHHLGRLEQSASGFGNFLRRSKLDELPQLYNVLVGDMSFVGPRPDVPGFADVLEGEDRVILQVKPGITGPATLKYKDEDRVLAAQHDPERYNQTIIWPDKVEINKIYVQTWSFYLDLKLLLKSIIN